MILYSGRNGPQKGPKVKVVNNLRECLPCLLSGTRLGISLSSTPSNWIIPWISIATSVVSLMRLEHYVLSHFKLFSGSMGEPPNMPVKQPKRLYERENALWKHKSTLLLLVMTEKEIRQYQHNID